MSFDRVVNEAEREQKRKLEHASQRPNIDFPTEKIDETPLEASGDPADRSVYHFVRSRPRITAEGGAAAHLSAFAYISDSSFIGTVPQVHNIPRFASIDALKSKLSQLKNPSDIDHQALEAYIHELEVAEEKKQANKKKLEKAQGAEEKEEAKRSEKSDWEMGMVVSMNHTIYFHTRHGFRADEWMLVKMYSPWAGEERGLAIQKAWARDGTLIATCVQEGIVRVKQTESPESGEKAKL
ncbi:hypothetical protein KEM54_002614 [Ascosphaera aggregata]|nr:hypothetical protein KEM54_002614 [Ascosphaera aggregata]